MSIGFFLDEDSAVVWRGPMLHKALTQFLEDVAWGQLDYLLVDLPPGTGDVSMTLSQLLPQARLPDRRRTPHRRPRRSPAAPPRWPGRSTSRSWGWSSTCPASPPRRGALPDLRRGRRRPLADELEVPLLGKVPLRWRCASRPTRGPRWSSPTPTTRPPRRSARPRAALWHVADRAARDAGAGPRGGASAGRHVVADGLAAAPPRGAAWPARRRGRNGRRSRSAARPSAWAPRAPRRPRRRCGRSRPRAAGPVRPPPAPSHASRTSGSPAARPPRAPSPRGTGVCSRAMLSVIAHSRSRSIEASVRATPGRLPSARAVGNAVRELTAGRAYLPA